MQSNRTDNKRKARKALIDTTNITFYKEDKIKNEGIEKCGTFDEKSWFPVQQVAQGEDIPKLPDRFKMQNKHPHLAFYDPNMETEFVSHEQLSTILNPNDETGMIKLLSETGVIAQSQTCKFCGGEMHHEKQENSWFWVCNRRLNGRKCTRGKFSIRDGTFLGKSHLPIQAILWIVWHFVHHLNEEQCKQYTNIGQKNCKTIVKWYAKCREVCSTWIWANKPKLGGFGKIVEMDESHFAGAPKFGRGRRLGEDPWKGTFKWAFGLVQRGSLDCVLKTVNSSRSRAILLPLINENCEEGTVFCSDGWKAYVKLSENIDIADTLHFPVNHSENYVDPVTGAHTQTIEGTWNHCKNFLPAFGLKPELLDSYLSTFMWFRYVKQRKLDRFKHFLICAGFVFRPTVSALPIASMLPLNDQIVTQKIMSDDDFQDV